MSKKMSHRGQKSTNDPDKKSFGDVVPTPYWLIDKMVELLDIKPGHRILEPACGDGRIVNAIIEKGLNTYIHGYELRGYFDIDNRIELDSDYEGGYSIGYERDFLCQFPPSMNNTISADSMDIDKSLTEKFDRIIINPPFSNLKCFHFVKECMDHWLKPGGLIVSIFPQYMIDNGEVRKKWLGKYLKKYYLLPKNVFKPEVPVLHGGVGMFADNDDKCEFGFIYKD